MYANKVRHTYDPLYKVGYIFFLLNSFTVVLFTVTDEFCTKLLLLLLWYFDRTFGASSYLLKDIKGKYLWKNAGQDMTSETAVTSDTIDHCDGEQKGKCIEIYWFGCFHKACREKPSETARSIQSQ